MEATEEFDSVYALYSREITRRSFFLSSPGNTTRPSSKRELGFGTECTADEGSYTEGLRRELLVGHKQARGRSFGGAIMPEMMRWLWRDGPVSTDPNDQ